MQQSFEVELHHEIGPGWRATFEYFIRRDTCQGEHSCHSSVRHSACETDPGVGREDIPRAGQWYGKDPQTIQSLTIPS